MFKEIYKVVPKRSLDLKHIILSLSLTIRRYVSKRVCNKQNRVSERMKDKENNGLSSHFHGRKEMSQILSSIKIVQLDSHAC